MNGLSHALGGKRPFTSEGRLKPTLLHDDILWKRLRVISLRLTGIFFRKQPLVQTWSSPITMYSYCCSIRTFLYTERQIFRFCNYTLNRNMKYRLCLIKILCEAATRLSLTRGSHATILLSLTESCSISEARQCFKTCLLYCRISNFLNCIF